MLKNTFEFLLLGAQLSSRCLSIDGSSSKCWSILTYPKRHEPSFETCGKQTILTH